MTAHSQVSSRKRAIGIALSLPVQTTLYLFLSSLIIWTVFFSTYPAAHSRTHSLRHHTLSVACH
ncbi:CbtB-domain containing protein [Chlorogloeopsis fritschii]|uniref:CbtB-domain containing protein n=1 Tax=Chlorogloeopsis fritschii TaxID=1124 RepID=UPI0002E6C4F7|nr:CbtB-domain containing protein [Chlorogloeopsis fritschii]